MSVPCPNHAPDVKPPDGDEPHNQTAFQLGAFKSTPVGARQKAGSTEDVPLSRAQGHVLAGRVAPGSGEG